MNVYLILILMFFFGGSLIVFSGYITISYYDFLDREKSIQNVVRLKLLNDIEIKGFEGEQNVNSFMQSILRPGEYYLRNLLIPLDEQRKAEIDGVLISRKGIFCIETKNWKGRINGFEKDDMWYQTKCGRARQIKNPVFQNTYHCNAIEKALHFDYEINNCVILYSTLDLTHIVSNNVFNIESFKSYYLLRKRTISRREVRLACDRLCLYIATSDEIKKYREVVRSKFIGA